ncbi:MAG: sarcinarray family MAST domain-containing protein [Methanosarcinaceae archaeon]
MKLKLIILIIILLSSNVVLAYNPYGEIYTYEVYYNGKLLPGTEVAKPNLKIGEPFSVAVEMTMYQYCQVYCKLLDLGTYSGSNFFIVIDGPSELGKSCDKLFLENETHTFEWTLKPTDEWAGGTMPINFHYEILLPDTTVSTVNSEFTIAVPYISTEHYEGDSTPPTTTTPDSPPSTESPNSIPAFTLLTTALAIALATRKQ